MIKFCTDSCVDIGKDLLEKNDIAVIPLYVILGEEEYLDGVNITPNEIFKYVQDNGVLPKTATRSVENYKDFYLENLKDGDEIIYLGISSQLSSSYQNAVNAKEELAQKDRIHVLDSKTLSSGIGLLLLYGKKLAEQGLSADEICQKLEKQIENNQTSFIVEKLDYLYKGGRCSALSRFGASLLNIKPILEVKNGKIENTSKLMGKFNVVCKKYIDQILAKYNNARCERCFITHTCKEETFVNEMVEYVKSKGIFDEVIASRAGATISCHCGENTLGILYLLNDEE
ncbi:MAG: DegV family protein [Clostridia bacterium]|nr:DegV family protein [Clostridia bacterium]